MSTNQLLGCQSPGHLERAKEKTSIEEECALTDLVLLGTVGHMDFRCFVIVRSSAWVCATSLLSDCRE